MKITSQFVALAMLFLYLIGTINGIGYSLYIHEYVTAISVAVLAVMAWPTASKCIDVLKGEQL